MHKYHLKLAGLFFVLISLGFVTLLFSTQTQETYDTIYDFETCVKAGGVILEKYPQECVLPNGNRFTETVEQYNLDQKSTTLTTSCIKIGGTYNQDLAECQGVSKSSCESIGGTFEECASPCRGNPNAEVCISMCEQTCLMK